VPLGVGQLPVQYDQRVQAMLDMPEEIQRRRIEREAEMAEAPAKLRRGRQRYLTRPTGPARSPRTIYLSASAGTHLETSPIARRRGWTLALRRSAVAARAAMEVRRRAAIGTELPAARRWPRL
jgi:hypothetical protein